MLKAFNRSVALSPAVSVHSTPNAAPNAQSNGLEQQPSEAQQQQQQQIQPLETGRISLTLNLEDVHTDGGDGASSAAATNPVFYAGMMLRGHKGDLVRLFELPPTERLLGDFHCAMRKRVLLQGRMYIFDHYVCFYSAVFGFAKKRRMPIRTITAVRKRKHLGFPNSLEIETDECKDFFTSFLSREEAYQLIVKQLPEAKRLAEGEDGSGMHRSTENGSASFLAGGGSGRELSSPPSTSRNGLLEGARRGTAAAGGSGAGHGIRGSGLNGERSLLTRNSGSMGDDGDDEEEDGSSVWVMEPRPAPSLAANSRHVLHTTLPGSPREFFDVVLADSAPFFEDFLESQGNRRINLATWKRHPQLGHVRDVNFTAPIKGAFGNWGVSHTACFQSQRFCLYTGEHIVFESSQTMTDIPYGDCFTVDQRWDIRRDPDADPDRPMLSFDLHVRVPFTNRCLFKSVIESGSVKQVQEAYTQFVEQLRPVLQERLLSRNTLNMEDLGDPALSQTPRINSGGGLAAGSVSLMARSMQHVPSTRALTPGGRAGGVHGSAAFEPGELAGDVPLLDRKPGRPSEPSVGRLLLSLGGRLAEGARGVLESGIDVVLNLTRCRTTPQMRFLVALVIIMFLANIVCMLGYLSHGWHGSGGGAATAAPPLAATATGGAVEAGPLLLDGSGGSAAAVASDQLAALLAGASRGGGGAGPYWAQRMALLQQEMQLLQSRMEILSKEVAVVMTHLTQPAAAGGGGGGAGGEL